jgi:hypothetical protein
VREYVDHVFAQLSRGSTDGGRTVLSRRGVLVVLSLVDAPFVELHDRQRTAVLATSNGAPPAASGTT